MCYRRYDSVSLFNHNTETKPERSDIYMLTDSVYHNMLVTWTPITRDSIKNDYYTGKKNSVMKKNNKYH